MKKTIYSSKWYWYIPLVSLFFLHEISIWILEPDDMSLRSNRINLLLFTIFPLHFLGLILIILNIDYNYIF
jgi:hypothetical protein